MSWASTCATAVEEKARGRGETVRRPRRGAAEEQRHPEGVSAQLGIISQSALKRNLKKLRGCARRPDS